MLEAEVEDEDVLPEELDVDADNALVDDVGTNEELEDGTGNPVDEELVVPF